MRYKILAVLALLVALAAPVAAQDDSYIIRADQIKGGTLGPSVTIDPETLPANVLTTGEVLAAGAVTVTDNGDGTITVETPTKAADASLLNGAAESTAADANTIAKRDANADLAVRRIVSALATGTSPFSILSTTLNANLNADLLDGQHASAFLGVSAKAADSSLLNGAADATAATASTIAKRDANADLTARRFISSIATGTSPLSVVSTTLNANLNADLLDGLEASAFSLTSHNHAGVYLPTGTAISVPSYTSTASSGTQPYACTSTTLNLNLNADLLDGNHASAFLGVSAKAADSSLLNGAADATAATANTIAKRDASGDLTSRRFLSTATTGTAPFSVASTTVTPNLNADLFDGYTAGNASGNVPVSNGTLNTNLNADTLDGNHSTAFLGASATAVNSSQLGGLSAATSATANTIGARDANADFTSRRFISGLATGISPFSVASTTLNLNLNADLLDGLTSGNASGNIPVSNGTLNTNLNADTLDGNHATAFLGATATAADSTKLNGYTLDTSNTATAANAYYYWDGTTLSIKRKAIADVIAEVGGGGGGGSYYPLTGGTLQGYAGVDRLKLNNSSLEILPYREEGAASWTAVTMASTGNFYDVGAAPDSQTMIAISNGTPKISRSTNAGSTWTGVSDLNAMTLYTVAPCGGGVWLTVGHLTTSPANYSIYRSTTDGATWSEIKAIPLADGAPQAVAANPTTGTCVAIIGGTGHVYRSTDYGATWTKIASAAATSNWVDVETDRAGTWIACSSNGATANAFSRSTDDGLTWTARASVGAWNWTTITTDRAGRWIALRADPSGSSGSINISADNGVSFTLGVTPTTIWSANGIATNRSGTWRIAGYRSSGNSADIWVSTDNGVTWATDSGAAVAGILYASLVYSDVSSVWVGCMSSAAYNAYRLAPAITEYVKISGGSGGVIMTGIPSATATAVHIDTTTGKLSYSASSLRFKDDVAPFVLDWDRFLALKPLTFTEKSTGEKGKLGFAAEWTAPLYPGEVPLDAAGRPFSVDYERLVVPTVAAVQEIKRERDGDAEEIRALREESAALSRRLEALERAAAPR